MKGEYKHSIDAKGRLAMPAKLREELGEHFTVTKGLDGCLSVYPEAEWKRLEDKIRTLGNGEKARRVKRYYFANAFDAQLDAQGRILIPANLRTFAELQKDVTVIGLSLALRLCRSSRTAFMWTPRPAAPVTRSALRSVCMIPAV